MSEVQIKGFEPSSNMKSKIKEKLWLLEEKSPSTSNQFFHLSKVSDNLYRGTIKVSSSQTQFFAEDSSDNVEDLINKLSDKMIFQIDDWKKTRKFCS